MDYFFSELPGEYERFKANSSEEDIARVRRVIAAFVRLNDVFNSDLRALCAQEVSEREARQAESIASIRRESTQAQMRAHEVQNTWVGRLRGLFRRLA